MPSPGNGNVLIGLLNRPIGRSKRLYGSVLLTALVIFFMDLVTRRELLPALQFSAIILVGGIGFYWLDGSLRAIWEAEKAWGE